MEHDNDGDTNCSWRTWNGQEKPGEETKLTEDLLKDNDHLDASTVKINWNTSIKKKNSHIANINSSSRSSYNNSSSSRCRNIKNSSSDNDNRSSK